MRDDKHQPGPGDDSVPRSTPYLPRHAILGAQKVALPGSFRRSLQASDRTGKRPGGRSKAQAEVSECVCQAMAGQGWSLEVIPRPEERRHAVLG